MILHLGGTIDKMPSSSRTKSVKGVKPPGSGAILARLGPSRSGPALGCQLRQPAWTSRGATTVLGLAG